MSYRRFLSVRVGILLIEISGGFLIVDNFFAGEISVGVLLIEISVEWLWKSDFGQFLAAGRILWRLGEIDNFGDMRDVAEFWSWVRKSLSDGKFWLVCWWNCLTKINENKGFLAINTPRIDPKC